jgi:hypothetical protein
MRQFGKVEIPQSAFLAALTMDARGVQLLIFVPRRDGRAA